MSDTQVIAAPPAVLNHKPTPHEIDDALRVLRDSRYTVPKREKIAFLDPADCLAEAWDESRLNVCRLLSSEGHKAPPVRAVAVKVGRRTYYSLTDGNHRVIAAAERGERVAAVVVEYGRAYPTRHFIRNGVLWRESELLWRTGKSLGWIVPKGLIAPFVSLGVRLLDAEDRK